MPKIITQHRRGTTDEWLASTLIPADGELIIEETDDYVTKTTVDAETEEEISTSTRVVKLKIGNGIDTFSALPYATLQSDNNIELLTKEVNTLIAADTENSDNTYHASELKDIRIGYDGIEHDTAGDAVRAIGEDVSSLRGSLQQFINADAVDGLFYEDSKLYLTADGVIVSDPVTIVGGSGGGGGTSSSITIKLKSLNDSNTFSVTEDSTVNLKFNFISEEDGESTGDGTCIVMVNGLQKKRYSIPQGDNTLDVTDYLSAGDNSIKITCSDIYGNSRTLVYSITVIELELSATFNPYVAYSSDIDFRYKAVGLVTKTVHFVMDGTAIGEATLSESSSGKETKQVISVANLTHGVHRLDVYATADLDGSPVESNHLIYDVLITIDQETAPMIASIYEIKQINEGDMVSIPYLVYDPNDAICNVTLEISYIENGETKLYSSKNVEVDQSLQTWATRDYPAKNSVIFSIKYENLVKSHTVKVVESNIKVSAEEGASLFLSAKGRSNNEANPNVWEYTNPETNNTITTDFNDFNWSSNGWVLDDNKDTCLRINGGATAVVNLSPFANLDDQLNIYGKTIEFEFAVRDVNDRETVIIDCSTTKDVTYDKTEEDAEGNKTTTTVTEKRTIGIKATADTAMLGTALDQVTCNYRESKKDDLEKIRISFVIDSKVAGSDRFIYSYLNGVLSSVFRYTEQDSFNSNTAIKLGDVGCTLDLYTIRVYNKALTAKEILNNYIADTTDIGTKLEVYADNDIYDKYGNLSYEKLKGKIPTITFIGKMPEYKGDKRIVKMDFENPFDTSKNFSNVYGGPIDVQIDVQGTSSQYYVRKNWKIKLGYDSEGNKVKNFPAYQHMDNELPAKVFCIKVDYAEGTGTHNTQNANFVETLYYNKVPAQYDTPEVRTTITGFPCVIFERADADSDPVFSSKGNFNFDKDAEDAFGFNDDYDVECWEFCNNTSQPCNFLGEIDSSKNWLDDFEPRYTPYDFDRLEELEDLQEEASKENATAVITPAEQEELAALRYNMIARFKKMHDWVVSTKDDIQKFKSEFTDYFDLHYSLIYYIYTFVALMVDQRAKNMFLTYWAERITKNDDGYWQISGVDTEYYAGNYDGIKVKDNTWHVIPKGELENPDAWIQVLIDDKPVIAGHWYPYFYDNDTSWGINNTGYLVFDYYHEDIDTYGSGVNVYNGQNSTLWVNFRQAFGAEIAEMYAKLRSDEKITYDAIVNLIIEDGSSRFSASIYNEDAEYKYLSMARYIDEDTAVNTSNLYQVKGNGEHHLKYFVENRIKYCDSKWDTADYKADNYIDLRVNTPPSTESTTQVVPPSPLITIKPYSDMYCRIKYGSSLSGPFRLTANEEKTFGDGIAITANDTETQIFGASEITDLGDLSPLYCQRCDISAATKLTRLQLGNKTKGYYNNNLTTLDLGSNTLLKYVDISNCSGLTGSVDASACPNIEEIYAHGTKISSVSLPAAGYLQKLYLPETLVDFTLKNQHKITTENVIIGSEDAINCSNITKLTIANCPNLDATSIFRACLNSDLTTNLTNVYITGIDWTINDWSDLRKLYAPKASSIEAGDYYIGENGNYWKKSYAEGVSDTDTGIVSDAGTGYGLKGLDLQGNSIDYLNIVGKCTINQDMSGENMAELAKYLPYVEFVIGEEYKLTSVVTFKDNSGNTLHVETIETNYTKDITCPDPTENGLEIPTRESTLVYDYAFAGWSRNNSYNALPQADALINILGNRTLYPAFTAILRKYPVEFYNQETFLERIENVPFYDTAVYSGEEPLKYPEDADKSEYYPFAGWLPAPTVVEDEISDDGVVKCYAQFKTIDEQWEIPTLAEITYTRDDSAKTLQITGRDTDWSDQPNVFVSLDSTFTVEDKGEYSVTEIGGFHDFADLQLIKLPNTLQKLNNVKVEENSLEVYKGTFQNCPKLQNAVIPENVTHVGPLTYAYNTGLKKVEYRAKDASASECTYGASPFRGSRSESGFELTIGKDVEVIPDYMFHEYSPAETLSTINTVEWEQDSKCTKIGKYAFSRSNIKHLSLPNSLTYIDSNAFEVNDSIEELSFPETINGLYLGPNAFTRWSKLKKLHISSSITNILDITFAQLPALEEITSDNSRYQILNGCLIDTENTDGYTLMKACASSRVHASIKKIGSNAFDSLPITSMEIPDGVEKLDNYAFYFCGNLENVTLPSTLNYIGSQAFYQCSKLSELNIPDTVTNIGSYALARTAINYITLPLSLKKISDNMFKYSDIIGVSFKDGCVTETVENQAFSYCYKLASIALPNSITSLGHSAFEEDYNLTSIKLSESITKIHPKTFKNTGITEIRIPDSVTEFTSTEDGSESQYGAFHNCVKLKKVYLGANTRTLSPYTFIGCGTEAEPLEIHTPIVEADLPEGWATGWGASYYTVVFESTGE